MKPHLLTPISRNDTLPIDLAVAKNYLKIEDDYDDELLKRIIFAVAIQCSSYSGLCLLKQHWRLQYPNSYQPVSLPIRPIMAVEEVKVHTPDAQVVVVKPSFYQLAGDVLKFKHSVAYGQLNIHIIAGFGESPDDIPADLLMTMLAHVADLYEARTTTSNFNMEAYHAYRFIQI